MQVVRHSSTEVGFAILVSPHSLNRVHRPAEPEIKTETLSMSRSARLQLDFTVGDDGFSASATKPPRAKATLKTAQVNMENVHIASLRALLDLGETEVSLGEVDSAVEVFQRRLR